jgi:hypothetical protein
VLRRLVTGVDFEMKVAVVVTGSSDSTIAGSFDSAVTGSRPMMSFE